MNMWTAWSVLQAVLAAIAGFVIWAALIAIVVTRLRDRP
jgi:hypothetical protein